MPEMTRTDALKAIDAAFPNPDRGLGGSRDEIAREKAISCESKGLTHRSEVLGT